MKYNLPQQVPGNWEVLVEKNHFTPVLTFFPSVQESGKYLRQDVGSKGLLNSWIREFYICYI